MRKRLFPATLVTILALAGCGLTDASPTAPPTQLQEGDHPAGRYTYSPFEPQIAVTLPDDEWTTFHLTPDFFDVAHQTQDGAVAVMFLDPMAFLTPSEEDIQPATMGEAIELLAAHEGATISQPRVAQIGGLAGLEVDAHFDIDDTHIIRVSGGNIGFGPNSDIRLAVLEADRGLLVIGLVAPAGRMAQAEELTESVRDSIVIH
jgi:hypothetical protein